MTNRGNSCRILRLSQRCPELWRSASRACACLRERSFRLLQSGQHSLLAGLKKLLLTVSRAVTDDILIAFSPTEGPSRLNTTEKGKAGKIHLPREIFRSLSNKTVHVVVTVLNIQQLGMFKEINQTAQVLDNTVVGITVGESSISGLQEPVQLTFAHRELPQVSQPCLPSLSPPVPIPLSPLNVSSGIPAKAGGWHNSGCVTQPGDKGTVCSCDHLTFFTLLLVTIPLPAAPACALAVLPAHFCGPLGVMSSHTGTISPVLDVSTAKALTVVATAGCGVAMAFSIFTMAFCIFIRCRFRFEETIRINLGLHVNLMGSLFLLNLAFLLNSGLSGRAHPSTCRVLGGFTHYCLLCCFTWTVLEGCQLYLLFVKTPWLSLFRCWITSKHLLVHYITNCGYFGLIFLFNMAIFGVVTHKSCSLQGTGAVQGYQKPWKVALVSVGLFCLLGATWALVFLTYGISSTAMLYLFTILNSFQGIFIFIWLVVLYYPKTRETTGSLSYIIRHEKTPTAPQD
ncbi:hypothetical protein IHE44_0002423 [Lamprotornis superbus]|uniref:Adhesion G protein-coupled receptor G3 n=1 Tax=Lamprotornis superbus TaxID=245042 RepID=A0A835NUP9_9PASS|nr:hypothetical protein IHE44_0002423 [Lamprotornis superbus]